jgi:hypothetical protein
MATEACGGGGGGGLIGIRKGITHMTLPFIHPLLLGLAVAFSGIVVGTHDCVDCVGDHFSGHSEFSGLLLQA